MIKAMLVVTLISGATGFSAAANDSFDALSTKDFLNKANIQGIQSVAGVAAAPAAKAAGQMSSQSAYKLIKADLAVYNQYVVGQVKDIKDIGTKVTTGYDAAVKAISEAEAATEPSVQQAKLEQAKGAVEDLMKLDDELYGHAGATGYDYGYINIRGYEFLPTILPETKDLINQTLAKISANTYKLIKADLAVYNQYVVGQVKDIKDIGTKVTTGYDAVVKAVSEAEAATEPSVQQAKLEQAKGAVEDLMKLDDELYGHAGATGYDYGYINIRGYEFLPTILPETKDLIDQALASIKK